MRWEYTNSFGAFQGVLHCTIRSVPQPCVPRPPSLQVCGRTSVCPAGSGWVCAADAQPILHLLILHVYAASLSAAGRPRREVPSPSAAFGVGFTEVFYSITQC